MKFCSLCFFELYCGGTSEIMTSSVRTPDHLHHLCVTAAADGVDELVRSADRTTITNL